MANKLIDWSRQLMHYSDQQKDENEQHSTNNQKHYCERYREVAAWLEGLFQDLTRFSLLPGVIWLYHIRSDTQREAAVQCFLRKIDCIKAFLGRVTSRLWDPPVFQPLLLSADVLSMLSSAIGRLRLLRILDFFADAQDNMALKRNTYMIGRLPASNIRSETWYILFQGLPRCSCGFCLQREYRHSLG